MKVIVAGSPKTGTKSMNAALTELGYRVYDYMDHLFYHSDDWMKIFEGKGGAEDFKRMYENIDAVVDMPACFYWEEIHKVFPDAKIILTMRDEEPWFKSLLNQFQIVNEKFSSYVVIYGLKFVPVLRKTVQHMKGYIPEVSGMPMQIGYFTLVVPINEMIAKKKFRERNAFVLHAAPKDKLLVYDVKQGWEPLCKFLDCDVPSKPFPHKNVGGNHAIDSAVDHEYGRQATKEFLLSLAILIAIISFLFYCLSDYSTLTRVASIICGFVVLLFIA